MARNDIAELRSRFAGCEIVMLADISTMTILAADSAIKLGQEHLDNLCTTAAAVFEPDTVSEVTTACLTRTTGTRMFARAGNGLPEVICGVFAPGAEVSGFLAAAQTLAASSACEVDHA